MARVFARITASTIILFLVQRHYGHPNQLRSSRSAASPHVGARGVDAPLQGEEINLETIDGVEQVTKLVLLKTDSLPDDSDGAIDGRYLNNLMETLYTGLRKPFKSVSADILGIFPSLEEIQVRCKRSSSSVVKVNEQRNKRRRSRQQIHRRSSPIGNMTGEAPNDSEFSDLNSISSHKSSVQVCHAVTGDCLSMNELVQILPPSVTTFKQALVGLCPVVLFRIINQLCHKSGHTLGEEPEVVIATQMAGIGQEGTETFGKEAEKDARSLNNLLRETKMLKNLQSSDDLGSKKPQKLHKKLKTQTTSNNNPRLSSGPLRQQHGVDEQLLKIRLKLTEPSIEKVWIFSLLFVVLSIVVSMGGLIVLPFVKKTTRRRILTLFEGLAVGGLAGSATLHMFPQAFGLVDEHYHKYFWRIFVVFLGIYLCYLCERIMKIVKVVRAKMRRSCASLAEMDMACYRISSTTNRHSYCGPRSSLGVNYDSRYHTVSSVDTEMRWGRHKKRDKQKFDSDCEECMSSKLSKKQRRQLLRNNSNSSSKFSRQDSGNYMIETVEFDSNACPECAAFEQQPNDVARKRLVRCLRSVQEQFSPVYAVQSIENVAPTPIDKKKIKQRESNESKKDEVAILIKQDARSRRNRLNEFSLSSGQDNRLDKASAKRRLKQKEVETRLYHKNRMQQNRHGSGELDREYLQRRLVNVKDVAGERHDQDNTARISVDTVAWMIVFGDAVLNVIDGLSIGAAFERNILAGISISVAVMLEEVMHRLGTFAVLIRAGMSMQQSLLCIFLSACALFPGLIVGILLSDATEDATPYIFCAAGGIFLYMVSRVLIRNAQVELERSPLT